VRAQSPNLNFKTRQDQARPARVRLPSYQVTLKTKKPPASITPARRPRPFPTLQIHHPHRHPIPFGEKLPHFHTPPPRPVSSSCPTPFPKGHLKRPLRKNPGSFSAVGVSNSGAGDGIRTRDLQLGKLTLQRFTVSQIDSQHFTCPAYLVDFPCFLIYFSICMFLNLSPPANHQTETNRKHRVL
jgi:hypothetical protein